MSRPRHLRHTVIHQIVESIASGHLTSPLPSQNALAEMLNVSRTTVRHILGQLVQQGTLDLQDGQYHVRQLPHASENLPHLHAAPEAQQQWFERAFYNMINQRELKPGQRFTELQLARTTGVSPVVVREFLLRFSRYALIENERRGSWRMKKFDQHWATQLFELREILETHALRKFMRLPASDARWLQARDQLARHRGLRDTIGGNFRLFAGLDRDFHALLLSAADNVFFNQSLEIISIIFHFHYQWDEKDLQQRNIVSVDQHMIILTAMLAGDEPAAAGALHSHLDTARQAMIKSLALDR
ncbi:GntR family transcriptional regulator [Entomohabitans teleogrylli]|uniref:GntR family transcriptional regulator n=1 Tax=Entomohabitans teleogrylli TaxID=1384589 RepID=UPI00073D5FEA|nr:GntR family transcriptional regulator [Entomohabitans teleogrylli]